MDEGAQEQSLGRTLPSFASFAKLIRQEVSTCAASGSTQCRGSGIPSNFCCTAGTTCLILASNTTVLCCPEGSTCGTVEIISCDVSQQNITTFPETDLMTTNLDGTLPSCGNACCPFGYSCNNDSAVCILDANQDEVSSTSLSPGPSGTTATISSDAVSTLSPTSEATIVPSDTSSSLLPTRRATVTDTASASTSTSGPVVQSTSTSSPTSPSRDADSTSAIIGILVGAVVVIVLITIAFTTCFFCRHRRRNRTSKPRPQSEYCKPELDSRTILHMEVAPRHPIWELDANRVHELSAGGGEVHELEAPHGLIELEAGEKRKQGVMKSWRSSLAIKAWV